MTDMTTSFRVLVLGSRGTIGRVVVEHLIARGHRVNEWDKVIDSSQDLSSSFNNLQLVKEIATVDFVIFLAFDVGGAKYIKTPNLDFMNRNLLIMANTFPLLEGKKIIFASSTMSNMGVPYGTLKLVGEHYTSILGGISVRLWNVYGPEEYGEKSHVITDFITMYKSEGYIRMLTNGQEARQFLHARDCAKCFEAILSSYGAMPSVVDVTSFKWTKVIDVAKIICEKVEVIEQLEADSHTRVNEPDPFILKYWRPEITLEEGVREMLSA